MFQDQLAPLHIQLGRQLAEEGKVAEAEAHFLAAGDWQSAVAAHRDAADWDAALRVAGEHGGAAAEDEVNRISVRCHEAGSSSASTV